MGISEGGREMLEYNWVIIGLLFLILLMFLFMMGLMADYRRNLKKIQENTANRLTELEGRVRTHRKVIKKLYKPKE